MRVRPSRSSPVPTRPLRPGAPESFTFILPDALATEALARWIAPQLKAGDTILLEGPVGAGKSHFARTLIGARRQAAGLPPEDVPSPTFTLVQYYDAGTVEIWHADLYRLTHPDEALELGLSDAFGSAICLVEWPDRLGPERPRDALTLTLTPLPDPEARRAQLRADAPRWTRLLRDAAAQFGPDTSDE
jgi:tRNA threonylcarbamoyl adenosine modification protein YjeE